MYDLNLNVPDITSEKYSDERRFVMLKNYLYELNDKLSFALGERMNGDYTEPTEG